MTLTDKPSSYRDEDVAVTIDGVPLRHKGLVLVVCWDGAIFLSRCGDKRGGYWSPQSAATVLRNCADLIDQRPGGDL